MSWSLPPDDVLNESGHTDNTGDQSNDGDRVGIFNASEYGLNVHAPDYHALQDTNTTYGEINESYYTDRSSSSPANSPSKQDFRTSSGSRVEKIDERYESAWSGAEYKVESPGLSDNWLGRESAASSDFFESSARSGEKNWPSLQIVCPEPTQQYSPSTEYQTLEPGAPRQYPYAYPPVMSPPRGARSAVLGAPSTARPMSYYPPSPAGLMEDAPLSYHKMGSYPYSPTMRHGGMGGPGGTGGGYRSSMYGGMQLTPRGPMSMMSPHRSPAINRRFMEPIDGYIYQVQFKRAHKNFILAPSAPRNIIPGDFVKVEADRGEDMGIVLSKSPASDFEEVMPTAGYRGRGFSSGQGERKFLFRLANAEERAALVTKVQDEERALEVIRSKVMEQMLPMTILDAEYQFDRHKLTYYFEADRRIDFRELVSELFSLYKTRIWMQQVDTSVLGMNDAGLELAKATGFLPERDDYAYLAASHMHRTEGIHGSAFQQGHGRGGGYSAHDDSRSLQYPPQLSQHPHPSMQQPLRSPAPGQRAEPSFQSPLYGGNTGTGTGTWGTPGPQQGQGMGYGQNFNQQTTTTIGYGQGQIQGQGLGQGRVEQDKYLMPLREPPAPQSGPYNTAFAYGPGGLLDTPSAPPQPALLQPLLPGRLPTAPPAVQAVPPMQPYPAMQPTGLYAPGSVIGPPPARSAVASQQVPQLQTQQSFFGSYGAPQAVPAAPQEELPSYFQPKQAGWDRDITYYPLEQHGSSGGGGRNQYQLLHPSEQAEQGDRSYTTLSPHHADGAGEGTYNVSDDRGGSGGEEGSADGAGAGDNASLNTFIEQWSLRDPR